MENPETIDTIKTVEDLQAALEAANQNLQRLLEEVEAVSFAAVRNREHLPNSGIEQTESEQESEAAFEQLAAILELRRKLGVTRAEDMNIADRQGELDLVVDHTEMDGDRFTGPGSSPAHLRRE